MIRIGAHLSGLERQLLSRVSLANATAVASTVQWSPGERLQEAAQDPTGVDASTESLLLSKYENQAALALASLNILQQQQASMVEIVRLLAGLD